MAQLLCVWETWRRAPYFAHLKVMRSVLRALREEVVVSGGVLRAYVFLEDRLAFVGEGPSAALSDALQRTRERTEESFRASDRKPLWGEQRAEAWTAPDRELLVARLRRLPVEAGLASDLTEYPWAGGDWLFPPD